MNFSSSVLIVALTTSPVPVQMTGEQLYNDYGRGGCVTCHGKDGNQPKMALIPKIGGQLAPYLASQMRDYHNKLRVNGLYIPMENVMATYSDDEIQLIADFLASKNAFLGGE